MLLAVALVMHRVYTANKSITTTVVSGAVLGALLVGFSIWHCITDDLAWHQLSFAIMICLVGIKTRAIIKQRVANPLVRKEVMKLTIIGGSKFIPTS